MRVWFERNERYVPSPNRASGLNSLLGVAPSPSSSFAPAHTIIDIIRISADIVCERFYDLTVLNYIRLTKFYLILSTCDDKGR